MTQFESSSGMALSWKTILLILPNSGVTFDALKTCSFCATLWIPVDRQVTRWPKGIDKARWTVRRRNLKVQVSFSEIFRVYHCFKGFFYANILCLQEKGAYNNELETAMLINQRKLCVSWSLVMDFEVSLKWRLATWFPYVPFPRLEKLGATMETTQGQANSLFHFSSAYFVEHFLVWLYF